MLKKLIIFNIIQDMLVEVAGIEPEFYSIYSGYCRVWCPYRCPSVQIKGGTRSSNSGCCILDSATVQGKGVSANADAVVVERICILYRVLENQRSISAARRISCRSVSAAYNNGELLECQNTI